MRVHALRNAPNFVFDATRPSLDAHETVSWQNVSNLTEEEVQRRKHAAYANSSEVFDDTADVVVDLERRFLAQIKDFHLDPSTAKLIWHGRTRTEWI